MHTPLVTRLAGSLAAVALLLTVVAPAVLAKEGVEVSLAAPISPNAQPGDVVAVFFNLAAITESGTEPLRGSDVVLRLYGPRGAMTEAAGVSRAKAGSYKAMIEIPAGGAARAEFGLRGVVKDASGKVIASDIIWPYDGILVSAAVPPPVQPDPAAGAKPAIGAQPAAGAETPTTPVAKPSATTALDPRLPVAGGLAAALLLVAGLLLGRRRRLHGSPA